MTKLVTIGLIYVVTVVAIVWDIIVAVEPSPGDTISKVALEAFLKHPSSAFVVGGMVGHFSSTMGGHLPHWWMWMSIPILVVITMAIALMDFKGWIPEYLSVPIWFVLFGMVSTYFLWPQKEM